MKVRTSQAMYEVKVESVPMIQSVQKYNAKEKMRTGEGGSFQWDFQCLRPNVRLPQIQAVNTWILHELQPPTCTFFPFFPAVPHTTPLYSLLARVYSHLSP
jgi:hypothetical protein